jgi:acyl carrier protein
MGHPRIPSRGLLAAVEDSFGITLPPAEITAENFATVPALSALVQRLTG